MSLYLRTFGGLSLERNEEPLTGSGSHRNVLALTAILACSGERGAGRETVASLLWPESDTGRARNALRQAVYLLRSEAGEGAVVGKHHLVLDPALVRSDVADFRAALARGDFERTVALYGGPFLNGFFIRNSTEFEHWVEQQRATLRRSYGVALETLAERAEAEGDFTGAVSLWKRRAAEEPLSSRTAVKLMQALIAGQDRPGALQVARIHQALVHEELGCDADPELLALARDLSEPAAWSDRPVARPESDEPGDTELERHPAAPPALPSPPPDGGSVSSPRRRIRTLAMITGLCLAGVLILGNRPEPAPLVAGNEVIVRVFDEPTADSTLPGVGRLAADWIRQGLSQTGLVDVTPMGLDGWLGTSPPLESQRGSIPAFVVSGLVYREADSLVLQATVTDHQGRQIGALDPVVTASAAPLEGVERLRQHVMSLLATHLNADLTAWATAARQPTSFAAYQAFASGMEAYARGGMREAREHYLRASALDPEYVLPLLWASYVGGGAGPLSDSINGLVAARRDRLTPFESAFFDYNVAWQSSEPEKAYRATGRLITIAPESEWLYLHGRMAFGTMRPYEAIEVLQRADPERGWLAGRAAVGYWTTLASAFKQTGQYERALETARRGQQDHPGDLSLLPLLEGAALAALGRTEELDSLRERLLFWDTPEARQDLPLAWPVGWAQELIAHGHEAAGLEMVDWTMELYRDMPAAMRGQFPKRIEYARMLWIAGRDQEARDSLARLAAERPAHSNVRLRYAMAAARTGDASTALETLESLEASGEWPVEPYWRFCVLAALGRSEEALVILRQYPHFRFHSWPGTHIDYAYPLMREYPRFLEALEPRDGPAEWHVRPVGKS